MGRGSRSCSANRQQRTRLPPSRLQSDPMTDGCGALIAAPASPTRSVICSSALPGGSNGSRMPDQFRVEIAPSQNVTALGYPAAAANRAGVTLILAHGAGADQRSGFMVAFASALAERGIDIVTFNFLYSEHGRRIPDPNGRLETCWRAVIETVRGLMASDDKLAIGGKSMGGRIASQVAADGAGDCSGNRATDHRRACLSAMPGAVCEPGG